MISRVRFEHEGDRWVVDEIVTLGIAKDRMSRRRQLMIDGLPYDSVHVIIRMGLSFDQEAGVA